MAELSAGSTHEDELIAAARTGNTEALWQLANRLRPYLKTVAARLLGEELAAKADASDVVQQALVAAVARFGQFRGTSAAEWQGWLVAIVRNETLDVLRYWHEQQRDVGRERALQAGSAVGPQPADPGTSPSEAARKREQAARLMDALDQLPPDYRQVIELRNFAGLGYAEIASRLDRSEEAVRQMWVRGLEKLRRQLGDCPL